MALITPQEYCRLAGIPGAGHYSDSGHGYAVLPAELLSVERSLAEQEPAVALGLNKLLCLALLEQFSLDNAPWNIPEKCRLLFQQQLSRIDQQLTTEPDTYFAFKNDSFRKDIAILRYRFIPFGAEFATPYSGIARRLITKNGLLQAWKFIRVIISSRGIQPFLELHMHTRCIESFNPEGWRETYENLADFIEINPSFLGVQSTSWFLDPELKRVSPHLAYLREVPERAGAVLLYAGDDDPAHSGAFATSHTRRALYHSGNYRPRLFTRIWPRRRILKRGWRT